MHLKKCSNYESQSIENMVAMASFMDFTLSVCKRDHLHTRCLQTPREVIFSNSGTGQAPKFCTMFYAGPNGKHLFWKYNLYAHARYLISF